MPDPIYVPHSSIFQSHSISEIDGFPYREGWGHVWIGGPLKNSPTVINQLRSLPGQFVVFTLNADNDQEFADGVKIKKVYRISIPDIPAGIFSTPDLLRYVKVAIAALVSGTNVYIHCTAGISRSGYFATALLARMFNLSVQDALNRIRLSRPVQPNQGFMQHLNKIAQSGELYR